ncbi:hypothetical protein CYMTET_6501 [Cymbomonas tetramitiformis]|uniref:Uncharacterized protein n=1 Tax=Cymbomonas tetramitiformis TaxID=36881 RepID=A0AAE0GXA3_9CHLO|nr:hypothetical protein CYMTET_6501 [Cymbomonas tetramitiformis]
MLKLDTLMLKSLPLGSLANLKAQPTRITMSASNLTVELPLAQIKMRLGPLDEKGQATLSSQAISNWNFRTMKKDRTLKRILVAKKKSARIVSQSVHAKGKQK